LQHVFSLIYAGNYNPSKFLSILLWVQEKKMIVAFHLILS
jgi:hypothetical protein